MNVAVAGLCSACAALLAWPRPARWEPTFGTLSSWAVALQCLGAAAAVLLLACLRTPALLVVVAISGVVAGSRAIRRQHSRRDVGRRREQVMIACESLAADLSAGLPPVAALAAMAAEWPEYQAVADAAAVGTDVSTALRQAAQVPGAELLRVTAAAWSVAQRSGAGLAAAVRFAADTIRSERATARTVATEIAAAVATARLLALLPLAILVIGRGTGGDPFGFLLRTLAGQCCLTAGTALAWLGSIWLERIADQVEQP